MVFDGYTEATLQLVRQQVAHLERKRTAIMIAFLKEQKLFDAEHMLICLLCDVDSNDGARVLIRAGMHQKTESGSLPSDDCWRPNVWSLPMRSEALYSPNYGLHTHWSERYSSVSEWLFGEPIPPWEKEKIA